MSELDRPDVGTDDDFFEAGGTSLQAALLASRLGQELSLPIESSLVFDFPTVLSLAAQLARFHPDPLRARFGASAVDSALRFDANGSEHDLLVSLRRGSGPPLVWVHPPGGIVVCYREIARHLPADLSVWGLRSRGIDPSEVLPPTLNDMVAEYVAAVQSLEVAGPVVFGGWSLGGVIAFELARQWINAGHEVGGVVLLDTAIPDRDDPASIAGQEYGVDLSLDQLAALTDDAQLPFLYQHARRLGVLDETAPEDLVRQTLHELQRRFAHHIRLCHAHRLAPLDRPALLIRPTQSPGQPDRRPDRGWGKWLRTVTVAEVRGHHHSMVQMPGAAESARAIAAFFKRLCGSPGGVGG